MTPPLYRDRRDAGQQLVTKLTAYSHQPNVLVLALPRGGVPVGYEVAKALHVPLDVFVVRKLGVPGHEELAMGAIATGDVEVLNDEVISLHRIPQSIIQAVILREQQELERRERLYRDDRPFPNLHDRIVILVDDGLATGATMRAAVEAVRKQHPARIVVAVPVAAPQVCDEFRTLVDEIICPHTPELFYGVGLWYEDFSQTTDDEVHDLLTQASEWSQASTA
jgi:putative phosphoribosyl transferase